MKSARKDTSPPSGPRQDPLADLVDGATAGDRAKMRDILKAVAPAVHTVVRLIMGPDNPDLADVAQEGLMAVRDALRIFRRESSVTQFARQVAVRTAMTARRRWHSRERGLRQLRLDVGPNAELGPSTDPLIRAYRTAAFRRLLDDLPDVQAETLTLRVILDYSLPQVASATGVSVNTVRSRVRLAKEKLRQRIQTDPVLADILRGE